MKHAHSPAPEPFWCPVEGCGRSETSCLDYWPFNRKDKRDEHLKKVHGALFLTAFHGDCNVLGSTNTSNVDPSPAVDAWDVTTTYEVPVGAAYPVNHHIDALSAVDPAVDMELGRFDGQLTTAADATAVLSVPDMASQTLLARPSTPFEQFYPRF